MSEVFLQNKKIYENIAKIKNIILVMSGKGGVGKSTVCANLALQLKESNNKIGILDMDISGANIPSMFGIKDDIIFDSDDDKNLIPLFVNDIKIASMALVGYKSYHALVWRSPVKTQIIRQLLADVLWGDLDYLIIDTPAGTGDEILTLAQTIFISGALVVSEPTKVSLLDASKSLTFCKQTNIPILGIVENMSYVLCNNCSQKTRLVKENHIKKFVEEDNINFLGSLPMDFELLQKEDDGDIANQNKDSDFYINMNNISKEIKNQISKHEELGTYKDLRDSFKSVMLKNKDDNTDFKPVQD